jgi:hypothetical protein
VGNGLFESGGELLVGDSQPGEGADQELCSFETIKNVSFSEGGQVSEQQPRMHLGRLLNPTIVDDQIVCITPPSGVQSFSTFKLSNDMDPQSPPPGCGYIRGCIIEQKSRGTDKGFYPNFLP